jgi:hypothetical protein
MEYLRKGVWAVPLSEFLDEYKDGKREVSNFLKSEASVRRWDGFTALVLGKSPSDLEVYIVQKSLWGTPFW